MPGIDLNLDLPLLADTLTDIVTKTATALSAIEDDLAGLITSGEIDINAELSCNGQPVTNVGGLRLAGGESTVVGTLYMDGSDLWVRTAAGAVKLTADGGVNIADSGGIGGDYGSGDEIVTYDFASQEYRFKANSTEYGDVVVDDVVLMGTGGGSVRLDVDAAITTARTFKFKTLNASGVSMLVYDAATSTLEASDTERATNVVNVTTLNASSTIVSSSTVKGTDLLHTADKKLRIPVELGRATSGAGVTITALSDYGPHKVAFNGLAYYTFPAHGLCTGDRLKEIFLRLNKTSGGDILVAVYRTDYDGLHYSVDSGTYSTSGVNNYTLTLGSPHTVQNFNNLYITVIAPAAGDELISCSVLFDRPV